MSTTSVSPTNGFPKNPAERVQISVLNDKFETVTLVKPIEVPPTVTSVDEALSYLGGSQEKLLKLLNGGLKNEAQAKARNSAGGWFDKEAEIPYDGVQLDSDKTTPLILGMAKTVYAGLYAQDKQAAKDAVVAFLQSDAGAPLRKGLVVSPSTEAEA